MPAKKYRWLCPHEWLSDKFKFQGDIEKVRDALFALAREADDDTLQKVFEPDMNRDEYFDPIETKLEWA